MTLEEWSALVVMALRRTRGCDAARAVLAATSQAGHDLDGYDTTELIAQWVTEALDPGGLAALVGDGPRRLPAWYRLHGLELTSAAPTASSWGGVQATVGERS